MWVEVLPCLKLSLVDLHDPTTIVLADNSKYISIPTSDNWNLVITPPGHENDLHFTPLAITTFVPGSVNVFTCADINVTCGDSGCTPLPDGIYNVKYTVQPDPNQTSLFTTTTEESNFIKVDQIICKYQHAFIKIDLECICHDHKYIKYKEDLRRAKLFIDGSVAACNEGNYIMSFNLYQKAEYILNHLCNLHGVPMNQTCGWSKPCSTCH